ncbi:MAG TPA: glucose-6-phosphate dehydrogenase assembly protein OpcA [Solirubrobacteraceae bacterium]
MPADLVEDVWRERDTSPARIEAALRGILSERHAESEGFVAARTLNLVAIVDAEFRGEIENRLQKVGRYLPSRTILCAVRKGQQTIDAWCSMAAEEPASSNGDRAIARERIELIIGPEHLKSLATIVDPLVVTDLATVVWAPHGHADGVDALRRLAQVVLIDSLDESEVSLALCRADELAGDLYIVDLAWLRSTPWRERVAAAFDPPAFRPSLKEISGVTVRHRPDSGASAMLFVGWLASRLGWRPERLTSRGDEWRGTVRARRGEVRLRLEPADDMKAPGLGGVTVETASGSSVSLDRSPGGLKEVRRERDGNEQSWTVLGASRGEPGILGEGVRQALLRDPTYKPALAAARVMVGR